MLPLDNGLIILCVLVTGFTFLTGLLTGIWKWRCMLNSENHQAPYYVDIAHRTALQYSFAGLLVAHFAYWSAWPVWLNAVAASALYLFFVSAIATYIKLGISNTTDNQFKQRNLATTWGMWALVTAELGGFLVLLSGTMLTAIR